MSKHLIYCLCVVTSVLLFACQDDRGDERSGDKCDCATGTNCSPEDLAACPAPTDCDCATGANCSPEDLLACETPYCDCVTGLNCAPWDCTSLPCDCATGVHCSPEELAACPASTVGCAEPCKEGQVCDELAGTCVDKSCSLDKPICDGQTLKYCIDGIEYQEVCDRGPCDAEHAQCEVLPCDGKCKENEYCDPEKRTCMPFECENTDASSCLENEVRKYCELNTFREQDCKQDGNVCENGQCVQCHDNGGKVSCVDGKLVKCVDGYLSTTYCEFGCDVAKAKCNECEVGSYRCTPRGEREICKGLSWEKKRCTSGWCDSEITPKTGECVSCTPDLNPDACDGVDSVIHCIWGDQDMPDVYGRTMSMSCKDGYACPAGETKCVPKQIDYCPDDSNKTEPGICGCGKADSGANLNDTDGDGVKNCVDDCPNNPFVAHLTADGCGCDQVVTKNLVFRDGSKCAYPINDAKEFATFRDKWNAGKYKGVAHPNFILMSDINFDDISNGTNKVEWDPVKNFTGDFDANGKTITFNKNGDIINQRFVSSGLFSQANHAKFTSFSHIVLNFEANKSIAGVLVDTATDCIFEKVSSRSDMISENLVPITFGGIVGQDVNGKYSNVQYGGASLASIFECNGICGGIVGKATNTSISDVHVKLSWKMGSDSVMGDVIGQYEIAEAKNDTSELKYIRVKHEHEVLGDGTSVWGGVIGKMYGKQLQSGKHYPKVILDDIYVDDEEKNSAILTKGGVIGELDLTHAGDIGLSRIKIGDLRGTANVWGELIGKVLRSTEDDAVNAKTTLTIEKIKDAKTIKSYTYPNGLIGRTEIEPGGAKELEVNFSTIYLDYERGELGLFGGVIGENRLRSDVNHHVKMTIDRVYAWIQTSTNHHDISYFGSVIGHNNLSNGSTYYDHLVMNITNVSAFINIRDYSDETLQLKAVGGLIGWDEMHGPMQRMTGNVSVMLNLINGWHTSLPLSARFGAIWGILSLNDTPPDHYRYYNLFGDGECYRNGYSNYNYHVSPVGYMDNYISGDAFGFYHDSSWLKEHGSLLSYCDVDDLATNLWCTDAGDLSILKSIVNNMQLSPFWGEEYEPGKFAYIYLKNVGSFDSVLSRLNAQTSTYQEYAPNGNLKWEGWPREIHLGVYAFPRLIMGTLIDSRDVPFQWDSPALKPET